MGISDIINDYVMVSPVRRSAPTPGQFPKGLFRVNAACHAPVQELRNIHPALANLALMNKHVRHRQLRCKSTLSKASLLPHLTKHRR
jgi:hypothetical protein